MNISLSEAEVSFIALIYIFNLTDTLDFCSCSRRLALPFSPYLIACAKKFALDPGVKCNWLLTTFVITNPI